MKRVRKHHRIEIICKECEIKFYDWPSNKRKFCSLKCRSNNYIGSKGFWYGKKRSKETKEKIGNALRGRKSSMTEEGKRIASEKISKRFHMHIETTAPLGNIFLYYAFILVLLYFITSVPTTTP